MVLHLIFCRSRSRSRDRKRSRSRSGGRGRRRRSRERDEFDPPPFDAERDKNRDDYTIFVHQIHPKVDDRDLFDFFSYVGRVLDIRLIRDQRTTKSKGLAYIEFWERDSVQKAISLNGCELGGYPISIQITQSEQQNSGNALPDIPMRLYVGSLHPVVTEADLRPFFEAFGALDSLSIAKETNGVSKCFAYVTFKKEAEAKLAQANLDGIEVAGRAIKVGVVDVAQTSFLESAGELDEGGGVALTAQSRQALMAKLGRSAGLAVPAAPGAGSQNIMAASNVNVPLIQATTCLVVKNMFNPATEADPDFHLDIEEDIRDECAKYKVTMSHIHVDKQHQNGHVFMRFEDVRSCQTIANAFHGRWFASRQITAEYVPEQTYMLRFPR